MIENHHGGQVKSHQPFQAARCAPYRLLHIPWERLRKRSGGEPFSPSACTASMSVFSIVKQPSPTPFKETTFCQ